MKPVVKLCKAEDIINVRHKVLRPDRDISSCFFVGDSDLKTLHFCAHVNDDIIGCVSYYKNNHALFNRKFGSNQYQLRGMAILDKYQGKGVGNELIKYSEDYLKMNAYQFIWCNARVNSTGFYRKFNFEPIGKSFTIQDVGRHFLMFKNLVND